MTKSTAVITTGAQLALFTPSEAVGGKLASCIVTKTNSNGAQQLSLMSLGDMKKVSGATGKTLKAWKRERQDELKGWMGRELGGIVASSQWTGNGMRVNKAGNRLTFTFVRCDGAPAMKEEEMCKRLGITMDQLNKVKEGQGQPIAPATAAKLGQGALSV